MDAAWDDLRAVKSAAWAELEFLSEYRKVLSDLGADCPHVVLEDDYLLPSGNGFDEVTDATLVWQRNLGAAEAAVREADDALRAATDNRTGYRYLNRSYGPSYNQLAPVRLGRSQRRGASFG
jgi:hypothetical protein